MKKHIFKIGVAAVAVLVALAVIFNPFFPVDRFITDRIYSRLNGTDSRIIIIGIDEESLAKYGNFTLWSRERLAELVNKLYEDEENAPAVVGMDFILTDHFDEVHDSELVEAIKKTDGRVVVGTNIVYRGAIETDSKGRMYYNTEHIEDVEMPFDELNEVAVSGFTNASISSDGYVRSTMNSIALPAEISDKAGATHDFFAYAVYKLYNEKTSGTTVTPATDNAGRFEFLYSGESGEFSEVSLEAVLSDRIPMNAFKDSIVLVGAYAPGFQDSYQPASDRGSSMYGVEIHANILQAYMQGKTLININEYLMALITSLIVVAFLVFSKNKKPALIISVSIILLILNALLGRMLSANGYYISCVYLLVALVLTDIYFILEKYVLERIRRRHTLDVFKKYVAPQVVDELSRTGDFELHLGGEKRDVALLFVDIRGFTSMSELLEPEQVVEILNEYLKHVTDCVLSHNGTLDKFIGDAAMAIFNAPFDLDDYIYEAVATAWDISKGSAELEKKLEEKFGRTVKFGVGVNNGPAIVGNIGCDFRMDYTAIGDTVNTAARLESNAGPGQVLISEGVRDALGDRIEVESVGEIPLKGKSNKIEVFSVTALKPKKKDPEKEP